MGTPPIFLLCKTQGESVIPGLLLLMFFQPLCFFNPSVLRPPPLYFAVQNTGEECDTCLSLQFDVFSI